MTFKRKTFCEQTCVEVIPVLTPEVSIIWDKIQILAVDVESIVLKLQNLLGFRKKSTDLGNQVDGLREIA